MGRALVAGGTGRLSGVVAELVPDGWYVAAPSRRDASPVPPTRTSKTTRLDRADRTRP